MSLEAFEQQRPRLHSLAYRMLGSVSDAEDVLQDAYLRWQTSGGEVERPAAWLTTVVTRLCLDRLGSARSRREVYVGPWLPEPLVTDASDADAESISFAFLLLLERLSPVERAAYLLHAIFDNDHRQVGEILGKSEAAVRQAFHRAKTQLGLARPRFAPNKQRHGELLFAFATACQTADPQALARLLAADVQSHTDGGGVVRAARKVVHGADAVARFFAGLAKKNQVTLRPEIIEINGWPTLVLFHDNAMHSMLAIETDGALIHTVHVITNPDKLAVLAQQLVGRA